MYFNQVKRTSLQNRLNFTLRNVLLYLFIYLFDISNYYIIIRSSPGISRRYSWYWPETPNLYLVRLGCLWFCIWLINGLFLVFLTNHKVYRGKSLQSWISLDTQLIISQCLHILTYLRTDEFNSIFCLDGQCEQTGMEPKPSEPKESIDILTNVKYVTNCAFLLHKLEEIDLMCDTSRCNNWFQSSTI